MEQIVKWDGLDLPVRAASIAQARGGYLLQGAPACLHPFGDTRFYRHGWQSWSQVAWLDLATSILPLEPPERRGQCDDPAYAGAPGHAGSAVGALDGADGKVLLLGALDLGARVSADRDVLRGAYEDGDGRWFLAYGPEAGVFADYAEHLAERFGRRGRGPAPRVWCSWYGLYLNVSEAVILPALAGAQGLSFEVFQLDDGWEVAVGDWEANQKFPSGMRALAQRIRAAGFRPGLWLAPLLVRDNARLCREHPHWLLRDAHGKLVPAGYNWGGQLYALDTTHPEAQSWLDGLIRKVMRWGYDYLKLDFLYAGALPGVRYAGIPREEAYRQAMARIRAVMDEESSQAYLLVCGAPVLPSLGIADAMRIGPDVAPYWDNEDRRVYLHDPTTPSALTAITTSLHRLWLRPLLHTDPDVVYFRTRYNLLMPHEQAYLRRLALIAGFKATSDLPVWLDPSERDELQAFLEAAPAVQRLGRYAYRVGDEIVDYSTLL